MSPELLPSPRQGQILVVEDDVLMRTMIAEELRGAGLSVIEAASADEALSCFAAGAAIDLLFTDVQMPGSIDGLELARRVSRLRPALPVIVTSGAGRPSAGVAGSFLPKPYDIERAVSTVLDMLGAPPP